MTKFAVVKEQLFSTGVPDTFTRFGGLCHFQLAPGSQSGLPPGLALDADTGAVSGRVPQGFELDKTVYKVKIVLQSKALVYGGVSPKMVGTEQDGKSMKCEFELEFEVQPLPPLGELVYRMGFGTKKDPTTVYEFDKATQVYVPAPFVQQVV